MIPRRWRLWLFLGGCVFSLFGSYEMVFGNTHWATSVGGIFAGMSMIVNVAQFLFKLPLESPQRKSPQGSGHIILLSDLQKPQGELILPASFDRSLFKRRQREVARRDQAIRLVLRGVNILMAVLPILAFGLMILLPLLGINLSPPSHVKIDSQSSEVQLVQNYCDALEKQDYVRAFSYFDQTEGGAFLGNLGRQPLSKNAFVNTARNADLQGKVSTCSIKDEIQSPDELCTAHGCSPSTPILTVQVIRGHRIPYLTHIEVEVDVWLTLIVSVDKL